jgi:geranylgeranyl diphosphate synthase type I
MNLLSEFSPLRVQVESLIEKYLISNTSEEFKEVVLHQVRAGGKRIRPALVLLSCMACNGRVEDALPVAAAMELIHNYSLIFDDIIDRGELRRGKPTTRKKYGDTMAILTAVHYREAITEALNNSKKPVQLHKLVAETIKALVEGERLDVLFEQAGRDDEYIVKHRRYDIGIDEYIEMVKCKTGMLLKTCCMAGAIVADAQEDFVNALGSYGINIGIAFQVADDIIDLFGEEGKVGKKIGKDIIEHKLGNIVLLLYIKSFPNEASKVLNVLRRDHVEYSDVLNIIETMESKGVKEKAYSFGLSYVWKAKESLNILPDTDAKQELLKLADLILYREY